MSDRWMSQRGASRAVVFTLWFVMACGGEEKSEGFGVTAGQGGTGGTAGTGIGGAAGTAGIGGSAGVANGGVGGAGTGSGGFVAAGSGGMTAAGSGGMSAAGSGGMMVAGDGGVGGTGASVMPPEPGQPYDVAQCTDAVAATLSTPECAECICAGCLDFINACRTDLDASSNPNSTMTQGQQCEAVLFCGNEHNCYGQLCYYGPCIFQIQESFTGGMPNTADETTMGHPLFNATAAANCKAEKCTDACAGNPEMQ